MMQDDLRLERQGDALIVHSKHNRWHGALGSASRSFGSQRSTGLGCPIRIGLALLATGSAS
jgi:hypothetical protein